MTRIIPLSLVRNGDVSKRAPSVAELKVEVDEAFARALAGAHDQAVADEVRFREAERSIQQLIFGVGRALLMLFLAVREQRLLESAPIGGRFEWLGRTYRTAPAIARNLSTLFGVIRYHRTYMREVAEKNRRGFHPLDLSLGLGADRFSWNVLSTAVCLATKLSFAEARATMANFVPHTPSTEVVEKAVLGFGRHTAAWLEQAPLAQDDGEVLVIQIDSKGAPTATEDELRRRRGKRRKRSTSSSKRHRGRRARGRYAKKPRRKKGDKSKNAKMATMVVMYTLRRVGTRRLEGPINRWVYASFAPKKHAFEVARRMAAKRGFGDETGNKIQLVTDGDTDLDRLAKLFFAKAEHTVDYYHVCEYIWTAGACLYAEGSEELRVWVAEQKRRLFVDEAHEVVAEMSRRRDAISKRGPGNKGRRERLAESIRYLDKRLANIRYGWLRRRDLEIGTGAVEGAIKHIIGRRCDHGGMRWIKERAEAVLQLRCIEINGQWSLFERFVHDRLYALARLDRAPQRLQHAEPAPLPQAA